MVELTMALHPAGAGVRLFASQYSAYCWALTAAFRARCFSRVLPAIFSSTP